MHIKRSSAVVAMHFRIMKRSMRIIYPTLNYDAALIQAKCSPLSVRRDAICTKTFDKLRQPGSRLEHLVPPSRDNEHGRNLRYTETD